MKKSLYFVLSEWLTDWVYGCNLPETGVPEDYRIAELVVADSPSQARYLAWKSDGSYLSDINEMPSFSCKKIDGGFVTNSRVVSCEKSWEQYWERV